MGVGEAVGVGIETMIVGVSGMAVGGRLESQPIKASDRTIARKQLNRNRFIQLNTIRALKMFKGANGGIEGVHHSFGTRGR